MRCANGPVKGRRRGIGGNGGRRERANRRSEKDFYPSGSRHPGGINVGLCDGSVRFVKDTINIATWQAISSTRGGEVVSADSL